MTMYDKYSEKFLHLNGRKNNTNKTTRSLLWKFKNR